MPYKKQKNKVKDKRWQTRQDRAKEDVGTIVKIKCKDNKQQIISIIWMCAPEICKLEKDKED